MKLVRNTTEDGWGKYALIHLDKLRKLIEIEPDFVYYMDEIKKAVTLSLNAELPSEIIELGKEGSEEEFFVIKLKDINASAALQAYADSAEKNGDAEFAHEIRNLAQRAAGKSNKKMPD